MMLAVLPWLWGWAVGTDPAPGEQTFPVDGDLRVLAVAIDRRTDIVPAPN